MTKSQEYPNCAILLSYLFSRWIIEPEEFLRNYDPTERPAETFLLYEICWNNRRNTWKNWCTNTHDLHAEKNFLQNYCEKISLRKNTPCSIIWYLSWSPCHSCSQDIIEFLRAHPKVRLEIKAAQLYKHQDERTQEGLRDLVRNGVKISIMHQSDYCKCWRTFVVPQRPSEVYWHLAFTRHFLSPISDYSKKLASILEDLSSEQ
ncbi:C-_U-editing enzyme APOBEC-1-like [Anolis sagrei]|uniref:C->U-editing enzyme APOBEC-1-like n=1 Tax=Anolis sagrei TaxID=38937 RepID=UPI0035202789